MSAAATENMPFDIGETWYGTKRTIDTTNLEAPWLEGKVVWVPDKHKLTGERTGLMRKLMIVRNLSGVNLVPKKLAHILAAAGANHGQTDGYTFAVASRGFPIDEFLPPAGVRHGDLFYVVIEGPALVKTPTVDNSGITYMNSVTAAAGTSATNADAGYIDLSSYAGATTALAAQIQNRVGFALTAALTTDHTKDVLVNVMPH